MSSPVIKVENLSKQYRLGQVGTGSLSHDINRLWHRARGKEDPYLKIGEENNRESKGNSDYVWALKDINFEIEQGDRVGIIGRNGAGKSTLLKILSRTTSPTSGSVKIKGKVASLLEVGTGFHPDLSGRDNIFLNGAILGMSKRDIKNRFDEIVDFAGVERYIDTPVKRYSSGMYVRLAFAVAAHLESDILIVDEVLAVGDAEFQKKCLGKMNEVSEGEGRTILFVSHNMAAIEGLCKQAILLQHGKVLYKDDVKHTIDKYLQLNQKLNETTIRNRTDRSGNGEIKIVDFFLENEKEQKVGSLRAGMTCYLVFEYECGNPQNAKNIDLGFSIHLQNESALSVLYTSYQNKEFKKIDSLGLFKCKLENLCLSKGTYLIGSRILANGLEADWISGPIASIEVESGDFYRTGIEGFGSSAPLLLNGEWTHITTRS